MSDVGLIADVLSSRFSQVNVREDYGWPQNTALCVLDCVLSLNRRYDSVVLPRVQMFARRRPEVVELVHLSDLMKMHEEAGAFCVKELTYNDVRREQTLKGVLEYMLIIQGKYGGDSEWKRLEAWAVAVRPEDYIAVGVRGFALSGFQYMRMLFGAQTTKPDIHIIRFMSQIVGRKVTDVKALELLEQAALKAHLPLREVDNAIWKAGARQKPARAA